MRQIHKTKSVCPECLKPLDAAYVEINNSIYLNKTCANHGKMNILYYRDARSFIQYLSLYKNYRQRIGKVFSPKPHQLCLYPTSMCNLNCPICSTKSGDAKYMQNVDELDPYLKKYRKSSINIFGGEPTVYPHLGKLIKRIRKYSSIPVIFSNGIKMAEMKYVRWLKKIGVEEVNLQYEGSEQANKRIRGSAWAHEKKLRAIMNLNKANIRIYLEVILERGINTEQISDIIEMGLQYRNIKSINFRPYFILGKNQRDSMPIDDMVTMAKDSTQGLISTDKVELFNRFILALPKKHLAVICMKHRYYLLVRHNGKYADIMEFFKIQKVSNRIRDLAKMYEKSRFFANTYFYAYIVPRIMTLRGFMLLSKIGVRKIGRIFGIKTDRYNEIVTIDFNGRCDNHVFDEQDLCGAAVVDFDSKYYPSFNVANIGREKLFRSEQDAN